jgi:hypothetical protein
VFWIPVPFADQNLMNLTDWQRSADTKPQTIELKDPDKNENYHVEILDYLGPYPMDAIPTFIAREIGGKAITGKIFEFLLRKRIPEFHDTKKILFYQVNPITNDEEKSKSTN